MFESLTVPGVVAAALIAPPSAELIDALVAIDVRKLNDGLQVDLMVAWERVTAWVMASQLPVVATVGEVAYAAAVESMKGSQESTEMPFRASHAEVGCALRLSERGGERRLAMARMITEELPAVQAALLLGDISYRHAVAIAETAEELDDPADRVWIADKVLPKARHQSVGELRRRLRRLLLAVQPKTAADRHAKAVTERFLEWSTLADGMAELRLVATGSDVKAVFNTVDAAARRLPRKGLDGRFIPIAARRADALVAMITGSAALTGSDEGVRKQAASIQVTMNLATALGLADDPAELAGYGPVPAPLARSLAADGKWRRLICDPLTGALIDLGTTVYKPNAELERFIRSRDARCSFPSCNQPAHRCEIDHTNPYREGQADTGTDRCNLGCLCEYHHDLKHQSGWQLHRDPLDHTGAWTSPTGHRYPVEHHDHRSPPTLSRRAALIDDSEIRWGDELINDLDWNEIDWFDLDTGEIVGTPSGCTPATNVPTAATSAERTDEVCPF